MNNPNSPMIQPQTPVLTDMSGSGIWEQTDVYTKGAVVADA